MVVSNIDLIKYGWDDFFADSKKLSENKNLEHGRVVSVHKSRYEVVVNDGVFSCEILGNIQFKKDPLEQPAVGDWVLLKNENNTWIIYELLPRKSLIKRQKKHDNFPKPIAANIDKAIIMQAVGPDFNIKRLERILVYVYEAKVIPLIIINKIDLVDDKILEKVKKELKNLNSDVKIIFTSYKTGEGIKELEEELVSGETVIFIGSSGVGKSSIINYILGKDLQETQVIMKTTGKGKHTTTARRLIKMNNGVLVIDTPGTREFGMHSDDKTAIKQNFEYIEKVAFDCKFSNCSHGNEPNCSIRNALESGDIDGEDYKRYLDLQKESQQTAKQMRQSEKQSSKQHSDQPLRSVRAGKTKK